MSCCIRTFRIFFYAFLPLLLTAALSAQTPGSALQFDGTDDHLTVPDDPAWPADTNGFTVETWVRFDAAPVNAILIGQDEGSGSFNKWIIGFIGGQFYVHFNAPGTSGYNPIVHPWTPVTGTYYHIAVTRQGSQYAFFLNGVLTAAGTESTPIPDVSAGLTIGQAEGFYMNGVLDDVRLWSHARSPHEIARNMFRHLSASEPGLLANWQFNDNGGTTASSLSGLFHATLVNGPQWIASGVPFAPVSVPVVITAAGEIVVPSAAMIADIRSASGADTIIISKVMTELQGTAPAGITGGHPGYWVVHSTGHHAPDASLTFGLGAGALSLTDQEDPSGITLFHRAIGSAGAWTPVGSAVRATFGSVTFSGITQWGEFAIGRSGGISPLSGTNGLFLTAASGEWKDPSTWVMIAGTDDDGLPDKDDDIVVRSGHLVTVASDNCMNILLEGASAGSRIQVTDGHYLNIYGTLNADTAALSPSLIVTNGGSHVAFAGSTHHLTGHRWGTGLSGWNTVFSLTGSDTGWIPTDFSASTFTVFTGTIIIGSAEAPKHLFINNGNAGEGMLNSNGSGGSLIVSGNIARDASFTSRFGTLSFVSGALEIGGPYLSAENIQLGYATYYYQVPTVLRVRSSAGLLIGTASYSHVGSLEYTGTVRQTSGNELRSNSLNELTVKNPFGVELLTSFTATTVYLDSGGITVPADVTLAAGTIHGRGHGIDGAGNLSVTSAFSTSHPSGFGGIFRNTGGKLIGTQGSCAMTFNGTAAQTLNCSQNDFYGWASVSLTLDNPAGAITNGSLRLSPITLVNGDLTVAAGDTITAVGLDAKGNIIDGAGTFLFHSGVLTTGHPDGVDGTLKTAATAFLGGQGSGIIFNAAVPQTAGLLLPDTLAWISLQNPSGVSLSRSLYLPSIDLNAQSCDLTLPAGVTFMTTGVNSGPVRKLTGAGNFTLTSGGNFTTQNPSGVNGVLDLSGTITFGTDHAFSFMNPGGGMQHTGTLLPPQVQYLTVTSDIVIDRPVSVVSQFEFGGGTIDNATHAVTMKNGSTVRRNGGELTALLGHEEFYHLFYPAQWLATGKEVPDDPSVLRDFQGGTSLTLSKSMTANGLVSVYPNTGVHTFRNVGAMAGGYYIAGRVAVPVPSAGTYRWDVANEPPSRFHPFQFNAASISDSVDITIRLLDTAVVPIDVPPASFRYLSFYYKAEYSRASEVSGSVLLTYADQDVASAGIPDDDSLRVIRWDGTAWTDVPVIARDKNSNTITAGPVDSLTTFVITGTELKGITELSRTEIDFGDVRRPEVKRDSFMVKNTGTWPISFSSVTVGTDPWTFSVTPRSLTILTGDSAWFDVAMNGIYDGSAASVLLSHNGLSGTDTVHLKGRIIYPAMQISAGSNIMGEVPVGESRSDTLWLYNTGTAPLIITSVMPNAPGFSGAVEKDTLSPKDSTRLFITFAPTSEGVLNAYLIVYSNIHQSGTNYYVTVSGTGTASRFIVSHSSLHFGDVKRGEARKDSLRVLNLGTVPLQIHSVMTSVPGFTVSPAAGTVATNDSLTFVVSFVPQSPGAVEGELIFVHSGASSPDSVHCSGTGVEPMFTASKSTLDLGTVDVGSMKYDSIVVSNSGNAPLIIAQAVSSDSLQYSVTPQTANIPVAGQRTFKVAFMPDGMGPHGAMITFRHNALPESTVIPVSGTGLLPVFQTTRRMIGFSSVRIDSVRKDSFTVSNGGNTSLSVTQIAVGDSQFSITPASVILAPGAHKEFTVTYHPRRPRGPDSTLIILKHNGRPDLDTMHLSGTGVEPLYTSSHELHFSAVAKGTTRMDTLRVFNEGNMPLTVSSAAFRGGRFTVMPAEFIVPPGASFPVPVSFTPAMRGSVADTLILTHDAQQRSDTVIVDGTGTEALFVADKRLLTFGKVLRGSVKHDSIVITNPGNMDLVIAPSYSMLPMFLLLPPTLTIPPLETRTVHVDFLPDAAGRFVSQLIFTHNGDGGADTLTAEGQGLMIVPIAGARRSPDGSEVVIEGVVTRSMGSMTRIQDSTGGIALRQTAGPFRDSVGSGGIRPGDVVRVNGVVTGHRQLKLIAEKELFTFDRLHRDHPLPAVQKVTLQDLRDNGEEYESELVSVSSLSLGTIKDSLFMSGVGYPLRHAADSTLSVLLRIPGAGDSQWDSVRVFRSIFSFAGIIGQDHESDSSKGYELVPVDSGDLIAEPVSVPEWARGLPTDFIMFQNYPNPFNPSTTIRFGVPVASFVRIEVFDIIGRSVRQLFNDRMDAGYRQVVWHAEVAAGIYFCRIECRPESGGKKGFVRTNKMLLLK